MILSTTSAIIALLALPALAEPRLFSIDQRTHAIPNNNPPPATPPFRPSFPASEIPTSPGRVHALAAAFGNSPPGFIPAKPQFDRQKPNRLRAEILSNARNPSNGWNPKHVLTSTSFNGEGFAPGANIAPSVNEKPKTSTRTQSPTSLGTSDLLRGAPPAGNGDDVNDPVLAYVIAQSRLESELKNAVREKEAGVPPFVSRRLDLTSLANQYQLEEARDLILHKISSLPHGWKYFRNIRGDGNCFYRAFGFTFIRNLMNAEDRSLSVDAAMNIIDRGIIPMLREHFKTREGQDRESLIAFRNLVYGVIEPARSRTLPLDDDLLLNIFQDKILSPLYVHFLRLVASVQIATNPGKYEDFMRDEDGDGMMSVDEYRRTRVEKDGIVADAVQATALCDALQVTIDIAWVNLENYEDVNIMHVPDGPRQNVYGTTENQMLLLRPGHYDVLEK
ncbi:OTU domain, ubiquitin aldehyde binding [Tulasnella sp. JGI-2019a]|nr:OTU domain, ubiquitin aldehyde binding [Tulasnella sp. JGI-2019a]